MERGNGLEEEKNGVRLIYILLVLILFTFHLYSIGLLSPVKAKACASIELAELAGF